MDAESTFSRICHSVALHSHFSTSIHRQGARILLWLAVMSAAVLAAFRQATKDGALRLTRHFHSGKPILGGHDAPHYIHAPNMYELWNMKNRPLKWGLATAGILIAGSGIPIVAVLYQQEKAKG
eukprot:jgi/Botrbrau1/7814/Bobra.0159s0242.1